MRQNESYLAQTLRHLAYLGVPVQLAYWPEADQWTADVGPSLAGWHCTAPTPAAALRQAYTAYRAECDK